MFVGVRSKTSKFLCILPLFLQTWMNVRKRMEDVLNSASTPTDRTTARAPPDMILTWTTPHVSVDFSTSIIVSSC